MKAYKGFDKNLKCRDFQYEVGKTYEEPVAHLCNSGFHGCENPMDVLSYYPPATSRYCEVELDEVSEQRDGDTKVCAKKITIVRELTTAGFINACAEYMAAGNFEAQSSGYQGHAQSSGDYAHAQSSGDYAHAQSSGYQGHAQSSGNYAHAQSSGYQGHAQSSGKYAHAQSSGNYAHAQSSGNYAHAQSSGNCGHAQSNGDYAHAQSSGYCGHAQSSGENSVAVSLGIWGQAQANKNCRFIVLTEHDENHKLVNVQVGRVGYEIEANKTYMLKDGKFCEVN